MKQSDNDLLHFGNMLSEVCAQTKTTVREICQEVGISSTTFENVWFGRTSNITHYLRVYRYLWGEASERIRKRMDAELLSLFHGWSRVEQLQKMIKNLENRNNRHNKQSE